MNEEYISEKSFKKKLSYLTDKDLKCYKLEQLNFSKTKT